MGKQLTTGEFLLGLGIGTLAGIIFSKPSVSKSSKKENLTVNELIHFYKKWSPFIIGVEKRKKMLDKFKMNISKDLPKMSKGALLNPILCYLFGLKLSACIMSARAAEIHLRFLYKEIEKQDANKMSFDNLINWARDRGLLNKLEQATLDYIRKARNFMIHSSVGKLEELEVLHVIHATIKFIVRTSETFKNIN